MHATHIRRAAQQQMSVPRVFMLEQSSPWARIGGSVIHPRLAALGVPSEVRDPSGIVNTSWDRLPAFCMWDLLFCVLCRCRTFYSCTVDCRPPTPSPPSASPCRLKASADLRARTGTISGLRTNNSHQLLVLVAAPTLGSQARCRSYR